MDPFLASFGATGLIGILAFLICSILLVVRKSRGRSIGKLAFACLVCLFVGVVGSGVAGNGFFVDGFQWPTADTGPPTEHEKEMEKKAEAIEDIELEIDFE